MSHYPNTANLFIQPVAFPRHNTGAEARGCASVINWSVPILRQQERADFPSSTLWATAHGGATFRISWS
ncbi:hypothetical protein PBY51_018713 [Eleginops maclovinus]|uniref:Uncharacterized protein n=1 Tax=Eleginops maclovinus TaxID=56733 RepID=A0AAN7Y485_ELEMC|nr:hypothetical protein PBY51_018713 [Eleginops maclovinus]